MFYVSLVPWVWQYPLVKPVVTPRFSVSCTSELMLKLAEVARNNNLHIQVSLSRLFLLTGP
jgi:cytosine/adenosine deaminase-related metal-dependent hydrolase